MTLMPTRLHATFAFAIAILCLHAPFASSGRAVTRNRPERKPTQSLDQAEAPTSPSVEGDCVSVGENDEYLNRLMAEKPELVECFQADGVIDLESRRLRAVHLAQPCYPRLASFARMSGTVEVEFVVDEAGNVVWAEIAKGHSLLADAVLKAICVSSFRPASCGGRLIKAKNTSPTVSRFVDSVDWAKHFIQNLPRFLEW